MIILYFIAMFQVAMGSCFILENIFKSDSFLYLFGSGILRDILEIIISLLMVLYIYFIIYVIGKGIESIN